MNLIDILSLTAGLMTMAGPMAQVAKIVHSKNVEGLSITSYLLLLCLGVFAVLIGVQYRIGTNSLTTLANAAIMYLLSRRIVFAFYGGLALAAGLSLLFMPWFLPRLITTEWVEPVAFICGLVSAACFLPQVLLTRRTRSVAALSLPMLVLLNAGMAIWFVVAVLLGNYSMVFWNGCLLLMLAELLRLKIVVERGRVSSRLVDEVIVPASTV